MYVVLSVSAMDCICHNHVGGCICPLYACKGPYISYTVWYFGLFVKVNAFILFMLELIFVSLGR